MIPGILGIHPVIGASSSIPVPASSTPSNAGAGGFVQQTSSPISIDYPSGIAANDIALLHVVMVDADSANTISTPAGWTSASNQDIDGETSGKNAVFWKRLAGGESGSVSVSPGSALSGPDLICGRMTIWRGAVASGTPYEQLGNNNGSSTSLTGSSVTTTGANRRILNFGCYGFSGTLTTATPSAGWTEVYDHASSLGSSGAGAKCYSIEKAVAGTLGAATHTLSTSRRWQVITLALIPT